MIWKRTCGVVPPLVQVRKPAGSRTFAEQRQGLLGSRGAPAHPPTEDSEWIQDSVLASQPPAIRHTPVLKQGWGGGSETAPRLF